MKKFLFVLVLFVGYVLPALGQQDEIFWIFPMNEYKSSAKKKPVKQKARPSSRKSMRKVADNWGFIRSPEPEWKIPTMAVRSAIIDRYLLSNGLVNYKKAVVQSGVTMSFKTGFYIDVLNSIQLERNKPVDSIEDDGGKEVSEIQGQTKAEINPGDELDYTFGWVGPFVLDINLDLGVTYCDLLKFGKIGSSEDVLYSYVKLSHTVGAEFTLQVTAEGFTVMSDSTYRGGALYGAGITRSDSYLGDELVVDMSLEGVYDTGNFGYKYGSLARGKVGLNWKVIKDLTVLFPQVSYYVPLSVRDGYTKETSVSSGLSYQFGGS